MKKQTKTERARKMDARIARVGFANLLSTKSGLKFIARRIALK